MSNAHILNADCLAALRDMPDASVDAIVTAEAMRREDVLTRVVLLSDGVASLGITDPAAFEALARQAHDREIGITTVGMGTAIDYALLDTLARTAGALHDDTCEVTVIGPALIGGSHGYQLLARC